MKKELDERFEKRKKLICELVADEMYVPMKEKELAAFMQVSKEDREAFREVLQALLSEGKLQITRQGKYCKPDENQLVGTFISNAKGFGFVEVEGCENDFYIPEDQVNGAFHEDRVMVRLLPGQRGKRQEATVVKVLERGMKQVVGTYEQSRNYGFVIPDNTKIGVDIFVPKERSKGAVNGHKVVVELTSYGDERHKPEGRVVEILGHINDPGVDIMSIVRSYGLPAEFGEKVMNQVERVPSEVQEADRNGRMDLRDLQMVTIDGEDAKDLDDAVSVFRDEKGLYHLGVHIADVSNYVQENSALDWEALERGTSVYLVDRVIPMLPHKLSNGICSLNQGVDRLALSCLMTINEKGDVVDYQIAETVICVDRRMSYTSVRKILEDKDEAERAEYEPLIPMFEMMEQLAAILRKKRHKRGSIDFDFAESKILLDENGHPVDIKPYERNVATKIIEDFMLIANETVTQHFFWLEIPFVYRTHEKPDPEKIMKLSTFIQNFGYHIKLTGEEVHPKELQKLLGKITDTDEAKYFYQTMPATEEYATLMNLAEKIKDEYHGMSMYTKVETTNEFYTLYNKLMENAQWQEVDSMTIRQPKEAVEGSKYVVFIKKVEGEEITLDAKFLTCQEVKTPTYEKEKIVTQETTKLPITGDNIILVIVFAVVIIALILVFIKMKKLNKKDNIKKD